MFRHLFRFFSPSGTRGRLSIFIFHRVLPEPDFLLPFEPDAVAFERVADFIARNFNVLSLTEAAARVSAGTLPAAAACVTFDDGYKDNFTIALPLLQKHGVTATFFIATGYLDGGRMWNDTVTEAARIFTGAEWDLTEFSLGSYPMNDKAERKAAVNQLITTLKYRSDSERDAVSCAIADRTGLANTSDLMMTSDQVRGLAHAGMAIGGHTVSHPILANLDSQHVFDEIRQGKLHLENITGAEVRVFAYPNGIPGRDYTRRDVEIVRDMGFECAVTTAWGVARSRSDVFQMPRFTPWDRTTLRFGARIVENLRRDSPSSV